MPAYEVIDAAKVRELPGKDDRPALDIVHLTIQSNGTKTLATMFQKKDTALPKPGDTLELELGEQDNFDKGRRKAKRAGAGGGFRGRSPRESRRIERQHAQHMALEYIRIKASIGGLPQEPNGKQGFDLSDVFQIADKFDEDLNPAPPASELPLDESQ